MKKLLCLLLVVGMLMTGSAAWAVGDIPMSINHMTDVEVVSGKTDYNAGDNHKEFYQAVMDAMVASAGSEEKEAHADDMALGAKYFNVRFSILNMFFNGRGHATLFSNGETLMRAWSDRDELVGWRILKGEGTFPVNQNPWGAYVITNDDGVEYELHGGAEIALSGQRIKFVPEGTTTVLSGDLPTILTTAKQMESKRVPYVEYKLNGDKTEVTGFDLRFVDPANPSVPLKAGIPGAAGTIALASDSYTYRISSEDLDFYTSKKTVWNEGDDMKDSVDFADIPNMPASVKLTELDGIEVRFSVNPSDVM